MQTTSREQIAENVRAALARRRLEQTAVAAHLGMSRGALGDRVRGVTHFRVDELQAIAALVDVPLTELLEPRTPEASVG